MNNENDGLLKRPEIARETSPERFIGLFRELTGMRRIDELVETQGVDVSGLAEIARIRGAVIVGSSADPNATPKDLDVLLVVDELVNHWAVEYAEELRSNFDMEFSMRAKNIDLERPLIFQLEHGRLDLPGFIPLNVEECEPLYKEAIGRTRNPQVFAYALPYGHAIESLVRQLREEE